jgi:hypothetical protein
MYTKSKNLLCSSFPGRFFVYSRAGYTLLFLGFNSQYFFQDESPYLKVFDFARVEGVIRLKVNNLKMKL